MKPGKTFGDVANIEHDIAPEKYNLHTSHDLILLVLLYNVGCYMCTFLPS